MRQKEKTPETGFMLFPQFTIQDGNEILASWPDLAIPAHDFHTGIHVKVERKRVLRQTDCRVSQALE